MPLAAETVFAQTAMRRSDRSAERGTALAQGLRSTMEVVHMNRIFLMSGLMALLLGACGGKSDSIGVAECDAYVQKLNQCADKIDMLAKTCSEAITDSKKANPQCDW
jgi:hypothetical protein